MTKMSHIMNIITKYILLFLIYFMWINFYNRDLLRACIYAILLSIITSCILKFFSSRTNKKILYSKKESNDIAQLSHFMLTSSTPTIKKFLLDIFKNYYDIIQKKDCIVLSGKTNCIILYMHFDKSVLRIDDIYGYIKGSKSNKDSTSIILCNKFEEDAKNLINRLQSCKFILYDTRDIYYEIIKPYDVSIPQSSHPLSTKSKVKIKQILNNALRKQNFKGYLYSGIVLLISSIFIRHTLYYVIFSTILIILAGICYFDLAKQTPKKISIFDK